MRPVNAVPAPSPRKSRLMWLWLLVPALAVVEVVLHFGIRSQVPTDMDWRDAGAFVRENFVPSDAVAAAPAWTDPLVRAAVGHSLSAATAGRSDLAAFDRLWVLSIRGADSAEAPAGTPAVDKEFGKVRVRRWDLPKNSVRYDFTEHLDSAVVTVARRGEETPCVAVSGVAEGGGLGRGPVMPANRFACVSGKKNSVVALTTIEDLDYAPRRCIYQPPVGKDPVRVHFADVPLGASLVLYGGLYNRDERQLTGAPVTVDVAVDGKSVGTMVHEDGDAWKRAEFALPAGAASGEVTVSVTAPSAKKRGFCWAATVRSGK